MSIKESVSVYFSLWHHDAMRLTSLKEDDNKQINQHVIHWHGHEVHVCILAFGLMLVIASPSNGQENVPNAQIVSVGKAHLELVANAKIISGIKLSDATKAGNQLQNTEMHMSIKQKPCTFANEVAPYNCEYHMLEVK